MGASKSSVYTLFELTPSSNNIDKMFRIKEISSSAPDALVKLPSVEDLVIGEVAVRELRIESRRSHNTRSFISGKRAITSRKRIVPCSYIVGFLLGGTKVRSCDDNHH
jgi:hypothetical protein